MTFVVVFLSLCTRIVGQYRIIRRYIVNYWQCRQIRCRQRHFDRACNVFGFVITWLCKACESKIGKSTPFYRHWGKVKCTLVQALRLCTGRTARKDCRNIALPFLHHGTRRGWGVRFTRRPLFTPGKDSYPLYRRLGGPQGRSGQVRKISSPPGFDPRTIQAAASRNTDYATRPTKLYADNGTRTNVVCFRRLFQSRVNALGYLRVCEGNAVQIHVVCEH